MRMIISIRNDNNYANGLYISLTIAPLSSSVTLTTMLTLATSSPSATNTAISSPEFVRVLGGMLPTSISSTCEIS